jgi:hypothetical protein
VVEKQIMNILRQACTYLAFATLLISAPTNARAEIEITVTNSGSGSINSYTSAEAESGEDSDASASAKSFIKSDGEGTEYDVVVEAESNGVVEKKSYQGQTEERENMILEVSAQGDADSQDAMEVNIDEGTSEVGENTFLVWLKKLWPAKDANTSAATSVQTDSEAEASTSTQDEQGIWASLIEFVKGLFN